MNRELAIIIIPIIVFVIGGNIALHYYYKQKRKLLFEDLADKNYELYNDIKINIITFSTWRFSYADVIFVDNSILILYKSGTPWPRQNNAILQFSISYSEKVFKGVSRVNMIDDEEIIGDKLKITIATNGLFNRKVEIYLNFKCKNIELITILNKHFLERTKYSM